MTFAMSGDEPLMACIYLLRHCQTRNSLTGLVSGQTDDEIVNNNGLKLFSSAARNLALAEVYASPLKRCRQTVHQLWSEIGFCLPVNWDKRLIERNMGNWEGKNKLQLANHYNDLFVNKKMNYMHTPPDGESFPDFYSRVNGFYLEIKKQLGKNPILICSHNQTLKLIYTLVMQIEIIDIWYSFDFEPGNLFEICLRHN